MHSVPKYASDSGNSAPLQITLANWGIFFESWVLRPLLRFWVSLLITFYFYLVIFFTSFGVLFLLLFVAIFFYFVVFEIVIFTFYCWFYDTHTSRYYRTAGHYFDSIEKKEKSFVNIKELELLWRSRSKAVVTLYVAIVTSLT